jgi:hypothetical protein
VQPEHLDLKLDPRFATGQGSALVVSNALNLNFKCQLMPGKFEASDYSAYRQTMSQALSFIEREVVFKADEH